MGEPGGICGILGSRIGETLGSGARGAPRGEVGGPVTIVDCQAWESCRLEAGTEARQPEAGSPEPLGVTTVGSGVSRDGGAGAEARSGGPGQEDEWCVDHRSEEEASRGSGASLGHPVTTVQRWLRRGEVFGDGRRRG
jgi:hypothetical protein